MNDDQAIYFRVGTGLLKPVIHLLRTLYLLEGLVYVNLIKKVSKQPILSVTVPETMTPEKAIDVAKSYEKLINKNLNNVKIDFENIQETLEQILENTSQVKVIPDWGSKGQIQKQDLEVYAELDEIYEKITDLRNVILQTNGFPSSLFENDSTQRIDIIQNSVRYTKKLKSFQQSIINGLKVFNGGKVLDFIDAKVIGALTEKFQKRYPNIKRIDVKNKITLHAVIKNLPLPRFADQIKSECVNILSTKDDIGSQINETSKSKFIDKVYKTKEIIGPIVDLFKAKEMIKDKKDLVKAIKKVKKPTKYWAASKEKKYLVISEGDSAISSIINGVGRDFCGFYPIKGKTSNVIKDPRKIKSDKELLDLANILVINFDPNQKELNYHSLDNKI